MESVVSFFCVGVFLRFSSDSALVSETVGSCESGHLEMGDMFAFRLISGERWGDEIGDIAGVLSI